MEIDDRHRTCAELIANTLFKMMLVQEAEHVGPRGLVMLHSPDNRARDKIAELLAEFESLYHGTKE